MASHSHKSWFQWQENHVPPNHKQCWVHVSPAPLPGWRSVVVVGRQSEVFCSSCKHTSKRFKPTVTLATEFKRSRLLAATIWSSRLIRSHLTYLRARRQAHLSCASRTDRAICAFRRLWYTDSTARPRTGYLLIKLCFDVNDGDLVLTGNQFTEFLVAVSVVMLRIHVRLWKVSIS